MGRRLSASLAWVKKRNGRFQTGVDICLSASSYHSLEWQSSWTSGVKSAYDFKGVAGVHVVRGKRSRVPRQLRGGEAGRCAGEPLRRRAAPLSARAAGSSRRISIIKKSLWQRRRLLSLERRPLLQQRRSGLLGKDSWSSSTKSKRTSSSWHSATHKKPRIRRNQRRLP